MSTPAADEEFLVADGPPRMRVTELRDDLPAALRVGLATLVGAVVLGVVWAFTAPAQQVVATGSGSARLEDHAFDQTAVFVLLLTAFAVVAAGTAWRVRVHRGPVVLAALTAASVAGSWLGARLGTLLAPTGDPVAVLVDRASATGGTGGTAGPPVPAQLLDLPPTLGSWWMVVVPGLAAALAYLLAAIWVGEEDMGRDDRADRPEDRADPVDPAGDPG